MVKGFDASLYETVQVFFPSKDGTKIPMFIVHSKVRQAGADLASSTRRDVCFPWGGA